MKLFCSAIIKFILGVVLVGLLVFLPAWDLHYVNGWIFMGALFIPMFIVGIIMMFVNPKLLEKRLSAIEKISKQSTLIKLSGLMFIAGFVVAGLDYRFKWVELPPYVTYIGLGIFLLSYIMYGEVLRENTYLSRTIEVQEGQKVVSTGLYGIVRHPMYSITIILFLTMPLMLGSLVSFIVFLSYPFIITKRIINEEKVLEEELKGYKEYKEKVRYRLIPFIW